MNPFKAFDKILRQHLTEDSVINLPLHWKQSWRYYHNVDHLIDVLQTIEKNPLFSTLNAYEKHVLVLAAFMHDIIYDPKRNDNEDLSIKYFKAFHKGSDGNFIKEVCDIIECTKYRKRPFKKLEKIFWEADNATFLRSLNDYKKIDRNIRKEFAHATNEQYKKGRTEFLRTNIGLFNSSVDKTIKEMIDYIQKTY